MICDELEYRQTHRDSEIIEVLLDPGEIVVAEKGAFLAAGPNVKIGSRLGQVQNQGAKTAVASTGAAVKRMMTGEGAFVTHMTSVAESGQESVYLAVPYPGEIIPVDLKKVGGELLCQRGAFLAGAHGTTIGFKVVKRVGAGLFGGEGLVLQRVRGDGMLLLHAGGSYQAIHLEDSSLNVDTGCLVAFESSLKYTVTRTGNIRSMLFSGEGVLLAKLTGTGWVYIQSMPIKRLTALLARQLRKFQKALAKE